MYFGIGCVSQTIQNGDVGITINMTATYGIIMAATTTIDITHLSSTEVSVANLSMTYSTATDDHMGISRQALSQSLTQSF